MDKLLTVGESIAAMEALRASVCQLVEREGEIRSRRDAELEAIRRKYDLLKARGRQRAAEESESALARFDQERAELKDRIETRSRWIEESLKRATARLETSVEQARSQQKYENQKDLLGANRAQEADGEAAEQTLRAFLSRLQLEAERLEDLRFRAGNYMGGYRSFRRSLIEEPNRSPETSSGDEDSVQEQLGLELNRLEDALSNSSRWFLSRCFAGISIWLLLSLLMGAGGLVAFIPQVSSGLGIASGELLAGLLAVGLGCLGIYGLGYWLARGPAATVVDLLGRSRCLLEQAQAVAAEGRNRDLAAAEQRLKATEIRLESAWQATRERADKQLKAGLEKLGLQHHRIKKQHAARSAEALRRLEAQDPAEATGYATGRAVRQIDDERHRLEEEVEVRFREGIDRVMELWNSQVLGTVSRLEASADAGARHFSDWGSQVWEGWSVPTKGEPMGRLGELRVDWDDFFDRKPVEDALVLPEGSELSVPLAVKLPRGESLVVDSDGPMGGDLRGALNAMVLRLLSTAPAGCIRFSFFDPVGLGRNFAGLMHLSDYDEQLINRRIWTQTGQMDECLRDLTEHMEKVMQMYLRNEYETLADYNLAAGSVSEKYHVIVIADFPSGFSESAVKRLQSIAVSGSRCGVYLLLHHDRRQPGLEEAVVSDLRKHCVWIESQGETYRLGNPSWKGVSLEWERLPVSDRQRNLIQRLGSQHSNAKRVEVAFGQVAPPGDRIWSLETAEELRVPIGQTGAAKQQFLELGKGTKQHALVAGKTGSGKSTLFHVIITNLALWCRPDRVEFYLIDFKKGVEFKCYATHRLPHARVVAIESDRDFGLSVLEQVDRELKRRGDLFRQHGVQDLQAYHHAAGGSTLPRTLLMIDEFQEFFVEDDRVAQNAAMLLDRIVRQGRAFGIHVILGSQTLGGTYTLARTTLAQMVVRIALQCDEADSYLIMDENNAAPRLLSRPGEGIYNDQAGASEGNHPFQTVWLSDQERDEALQRVHAVVMAKTWTSEGPIVFEGNAPALVEENRALHESLEGRPASTRDPVQAWFGSPNAIKGPTAAAFGQGEGAHLLVIGQNDEMAFSVTLCSLLSLAAQHAADGARFFILDSLGDTSPYRGRLDDLVRAMPHSVSTLREETLEGMMERLDRILDSVDEASRSVSTYFIVIGLQAFRKLRMEDEFSFSSLGSDEEGTQPGAAFDRVLREGPGQGVRVIATVDSLNSCQRFLSRKALSEFERRVLFQMSANDSAALIDSTKASQLGLYRALFYDERKGYLETFRPYALPGKEWLAQAASALGKRPVKSPVA